MKAIFDASNVDNCTNFFGNLLPEVINKNMKLPVPFFVSFWSFYLFLFLFISLFVVIVLLKTARDFVVFLFIVLGYFNCLSMRKPF